jgi:hypothetical protein
VENLAKFPQKIAKLVKFTSEKKKKNPKISQFLKIKSHKIWLKKETLLRGSFKFF